MNILHKFVDKIPAEKDEAVLYISLKHWVAIHKCPCGCGNVVATRIAPKHWKLELDGETASLRPSISNNNFPCKSHYYITNDAVRFCKSYTPKPSNERKKSTFLEKWKKIKRNK